VRTRNQSGSVTAELVLTLPAVLLVIAIAISAMSVQITKLQLVASAVQIAKAVARGESAEFIDQLLADSGDDIGFEIVESDDLVCVSLSSQVMFPGIDLAVLDLIETQCARAQGQ
jgi:hypothetical protein